MSHEETAVDPVQVTIDVPEDEQMSSFQNGTLQSFGIHFAVTIQTFVQWPAGSDFTQQEAADYIAELLHTANVRTDGRLTFEMQLGLSTETESLPPEDQPKLN